MVAGDPTPKARRDLMAACRALMRSLLLTREGAGSEWARRLRLAVKHVEDAARCVEPSRASESEEVDRIAGGLAQLYLANLLAQEEKHYATRTARPTADDAPEPDGFQGFSWAISIADLLSFLQMQGATGVLRVDTGEEVISLVFEQGDLGNAFSDNSPPGFRLGEILVELGVIDSARLETFLESFEPGKERLGDALQREGLITRENLESALEFQIKLIFLRLLCSEQAQFSYRQGPAGEETAQRFNVLQLLLDACRIRDEAKSA